MRLLVIGHAVSPHLGSEPGLTWNWAWRMAEAGHDVWLIAHPHFREPVERFLAERPGARLRVVWASLPRRLDPWNPERGERWLNLHYVLWLRVAHRIAARLVTAEGIELVHHVSLGTVGAPPPFWRLPVPFVWGPIGGAQTAPAAFRDLFRGSWRAERLRALRLAVVARSPSLRACARGSAVVLCTNGETAEMVRRAGAGDVRVAADNGIDPARLAPYAPRTRADGPLRLLWAGRMEPRKGLPLLLRALAWLPDIAVEATVAGDGPEEPACRRLAADLGLEERVRFLGRVPADRMEALFGEADAFVFTSLRDSLGSVTLEALWRGTPLITLNHQGQKAIIPDAAAVKVPVGDLPATVAALADAIHRLARDPALLDRLAARGHAFATTLLWDRRAAAMAGLFHEILSRRPPTTAGEPCHAKTPRSALS